MKQMKEEECIQEDIIDEHIPDGEIKCVILGTMASYSARKIDGIKPNEPFYYHDGRNRFWETLTCLLDGEANKFKKDIPAKKNFLNKQGIAMANVTKQIKGIGSSKDTVIFKSKCRNDLEFQYKKLTPEFNKILKSKPIFFTRYSCPELNDLLQGFFKFNSIDISTDRLIYLRAPHSNSYQKISSQWKDAVGNVLKIKN